jgi:hypothetical protein
VNRGNTEKVCALFYPERQKLAEDKQSARWWPGTNIKLAKIIVEILHFKTRTNSGRIEELWLLRGNFLRYGRVCCIIGEDGIHVLG